MRYALRVPQQSAYREKGRALCRVRIFVPAPEEVGLPPVDFRGDPVAESLGQPPEDGAHALEVELLGETAGRQDDPVRDPPS